MRKFVIKNRKKRKYTKKSEQNASPTFIKALYSTLPLLIMLVAFMATMAITSPLHIPLNTINFTFDLPRISLQNPQNFLQFSWNIVGQSYTALWHSTQIAVEIMVQSTRLFDLQPLLTFLNQTGASLAIAGISLFAFMDHIVVTLVVNSFTTTSQVAQGATKSSVSSVIWIMHEGSMIALTLWKATTWGANALAHTTVVLSGTIYNVSAYIVQLILAWLWSVWIALASWVIHTVNLILSLIAWPFKIAAAYLLRYKPLADMLGKHMGMALNDMGICFSNFAKTMSSLGTNK